MIAQSSAALRVVIYEGAGAQPIDAGARFEMLRALLEKGYAVSMVRAGGRVSEVSAGTIIVLGRFAGGSPPRIETAAHDVNVVMGDISGIEPNGIVSLIESMARQAGSAKPSGWKPWFPVIDYQRCTNCMQCLSFCLFDVYGVSVNGKIQVQKQDNCKTDCPACSRVCPEVAILFPKYRFGPINGEEVNPEDLRREAMKVDISALLGGDIYAALRDRSARAKSRFSKERDDDRALAERQRCLTKLQQATAEMDIPASVLASLPSIDEIQAKALQAKARAEAALRGAAHGASTTTATETSST